MKLFKSKREKLNEYNLENYGLTTHQISTLARYNAEKARGILHTDSWKDLMAEYQQIFDTKRLEGYEHLGNGVYVKQA